MEQVTDHTLVSVDVLVPGLLGSLSVAFAFSIGLFYIGLLVLLVKIFGHEVENSVDALLGVMLTITLKSDVVLS